MQNFTTSRRSFLQGTLATLALGSTALTASAAPAKKPLPLACSSIAFTKLSIEQAVAKIAELGFDAIDVWSGHAGCPHLDDVLNRLGASAFTKLLDKHKLSLYSFSVYRGGYAKYAKLLNDCGGGVAVHGSTRPPAKGQSLEEAVKLYIKKLEPELELAEKNNAKIAAENHAGALLNDIASLREFVKQAKAHPRLGVALAPFHLQRLKASVPEAIEICGDKLFFFYAWQNEKGDKQLPGIGSTNMQPWIDALRKIKFPHPITPFMHHEPDPEEMAKLFTKSRKYLSEM